MRVVIGVGNELRRDDSIGLRIVESLRGMEGDELKLLIGETVPENLIGEVQKLNPDEIVIIDAIDFGGEAGDVKVVEDFKGIGSTHKMSYSLFSRFFKCPVKVMGIQPKDVGHGEGLSKEIEEKFDELKERVKISLERDAP